MKFITEITPEKLRGGFYTPDPIVDFCFERLRALRCGRRLNRFLEPSAGDGAFVRGLKRAKTRGLVRDPVVTCVEIAPEEASLCAAALRDQGLRGEVVADSFFSWRPNGYPIDAVIGNPPFVRYQFVDAEERRLAEVVLRSHGIQVDGVSNLWIPLTFAALAVLPPEGTFAIVLPSEALSTVSGGRFRKWLIEHFNEIQADFFPRGAFPEILQDVLVLSGTRRASPGSVSRLRLVEHSRDSQLAHDHQVTASCASWTRYLLHPKQLAAYEALAAFPEFLPLKRLARLSVAIVTGANQYFTVDDETVGKYALARWARPLLARTADSAGLVFKPADHARAVREGRRAWFLDFSESEPDPERASRAAAYLREGEAAELHTRYKCRIRVPWYRVPHVRHGELMMAKRAHLHPRLLLNQAKVMTTDTIYRGEMMKDYRGRADDLVAGFHNSGTLLSTEMEGRTYGGGVLELVPSEIARLLAPMCTIGSRLCDLDALSRRQSGQRDASEAVVAETDRLLGSLMPAYGVLLPQLREARMVLRDRRLRAVESAED